jgi:NAD(P)-dependent dehydrogenase (short-subunit alcohol dehydrogenase family)
MDLAGRVAVVTGGAGGIGRALCRRFAAEGARGVVVADIDADGAVAVAGELKGLAVATDVSVEADVQHLVEAALDAYGSIDLFCSNAGIVTGGFDAVAGIETTDEDWDRIWRVNVLAHLFAARAVVPHMLERGGGHLLNTISAAGLLTIIGNVPYAVTKHAALALAEWLAITYGDQGIGVSCLCPEAVKTDMLPEDSYLAEGALEPEEVAGAVVQGLADGSFLILPHPAVAEYFRQKATDYDRWLRGMRRFQARVMKS